jgi:hypothetical protein
VVDHHQGYHSDWYRQLAYDVFYHFVCTVHRQSSRLQVIFLDDVAQEVVQSPPSLVDRKFVKLPHFGRSDLLVDQVEDSFVLADAVFCQLQPRRSLFVMSAPLLVDFTQIVDIVGQERVVHFQSSPETAVCFLFLQHERGVGLDIDFGPVLQEELSLFDLLLG